jgi:glycosyltransferase involved in cell wall biosynthesis
MLKRCRPHVRTFYGSALGEAVHATSTKVCAIQFTLYPSELLSALLADRRITISKRTKKYIPFVDDVIPCGIDLSLFCPGVVKAANPSILFVGTLEGRKRGRLLLEIFRQSISKQLPNAELWMVCEDVTDDQYHHDRITFFRRLPTEALVSLYQKAWIFCLPSTYEGFGVPYIEAMATGTPVVATPNGGAQEVLDEGRWGCLVREQELSCTLVHLLTSEEKRLSFAEGGLKRAKEYDMALIAERYDALYQRIVGQTHLPPSKEICM